MSDTIDDKTFSGFGPEGGLDELENELGATHAPGASDKPKKQFPVLPVAGGFAALVVILGGAFAYTAMRGHGTRSDQMVDVPQPQMQMQQVQQQAGVPPLPPGMPNGGGFQPGQMQVPPGAPMPVAQQPYAPNMQGAAMQPAMAQAAQINATPPNPVVNSYQNMNPGAQPMSAANPGQPVTQPVVPNTQPPVTNAVVANAGAGAQPITTQAVANQMQPQQPTTADVSNSAGAMRGVATPVQQSQQTRQDPQPVGPVPVVEGRHPTHAVHSTSNDPAVAALQAQVNELMQKQKELQDQLKAKDGSGKQRQKSTKHAAVAAQPSDDQEASADTQDGQDAEKPVAPSRAPRKGKAATKTAKADKFTRDGGHVLTGMIDNRAFVSRTSGGDVNPAAVYAPGDTLEDGRKILSIDGKNKRVWLEGGQYIGTDSDK